MLTIDQARGVLNEVIEKIQVDHATYMTLANSLELLYGEARESLETKQTIADHNMTDTNGANNG